METYVAWAWALPRKRADPPVMVARASTLVELGVRVRRRAPAARVTLFDRASDVRIDGLQVWGLALEPGRTIYLCGASLDEA